ncbi:MAG: DUF3618 domain-containing protein [Alphaproteobacteria bacterium]|nr:DUF3618 domain-containing protein [Alphaproteobacteria bacterium]MBV9372553.1 DUF3618 domain-containing protein [Alphaproteobacteria bacterium]MBV9899903.1 DUF3618 domain-containing protein [Alphaproteobacteria bacterium]
MSAPEILRARREAEEARRRLAATAAELQQRLRPGTIAHNAWDGVKERSGELAEDAVEAVKARPVVVSAGLAAFTLFLARGSIRSVVSRLFHSGAGDDDLVTTRLDRHDRNYDLTAPVTERPVKQGADA